MRRDMTWRCHTLSPLLCVLAIAGCAHPEQYRWNDLGQTRFEGSLAEPPGSRFARWSRPAVSVYSFATPATGTPDLTLRDLSDHGQAALITAMTAAGAKPDEIRETLSKPLKARTEAAEGAITSESSYRRTLVANVTKGWDAVPGERLIWTWIRIKPLNFAFEGYSVIATDNQLLNIEQITNSTAGSLSANLGRTGSNTETTNTSGSPVSSVLSDVAGSSAGVSGTLSNTYTTTAAINQQYMKLGADIVPDELRIYRESERNLDVAGNTLIALTVKLDPSKWRGVAMETTLRVTRLDLSAPNGSFTDPSAATFEVVQNEAPPSCALQAQVTLFYQVRRPTNGRSYVEGEHAATYAKESTTPAIIEIVPADQVRRPSWRVYPRLAPDSALQVTGTFENDSPIDFTSYEQAQNFVVWFGHYSDKLKGEMYPSIGTAGLRLSSGIDGQPVFTGDYFARRVAGPDNLAEQCAGMIPTASPAPTPPAPSSGKLE